MDFLEHRYQEGSVDVFGYLHDVDVSLSSAFSDDLRVVQNDDLQQLFDSRPVIGLMGLLPGYSPLNVISTELLDSVSVGYETQSVLDCLDKSSDILNKVGSEAYSPLPSLDSMYDWVGQLHGLVPGETVYHNSNFILSFGMVIHHYEAMGHNTIDIIDKISSGDRVNQEVYDRAIIPGDGKKILGLLGLLPGSTTLNMMMSQGEIVDDASVPYPSSRSYSPSIVDALDMVFASSGTTVTIAVPYV